MPDFHPSHAHPGDSAVPDLRDAPDGVRRGLLIGGLMGAAALAAYALTPTRLVESPTSLASIVPSRFGSWQEIPSAVRQADLFVRRDTGPDMNNPYDDVLMRSYTNSLGETVMLALAYGRRQTQEVKIHRPELCYIAQGYQITADSQTVIDGAPGLRPIDGHRLLAEAPGRTEAISYWIRIGDLFSQDAWQTRSYLFREGLLKRRVPDGILVRASQFVSDPTQLDATYRVQERFLLELVQATAPAGRRMLVG